MGWRIVQQPNKLFARFSEVVDDFTDGDMTNEEVINLCMTEHGLSQSKATAKVQDALDNPQRWEDAMRIIRSVHGEERSTKVLQEIGKPDPLAIATATATEKANQFVEQEQYRDRPFATTYLISDIASDIGKALYDAGYIWNELSLDTKNTIAAEALEKAGYRTLQEKLDNWIITHEG